MWLVLTGHYRLPLFVLFACLVGIPFVIRKLPPVTTDSQEIRSNQVRASSSLRRLGWIYVAGLIFGTFNLLGGGLKEAPWWVALIGIGWSAFLIWACFWAAKRYRNSAAAESEKPEN
jgi:protein-S-isoprenylcysteine O-methyltransferase Ste14